MKYKVLINGRNSGLISDFIQYTDSYFTCLSTSSCFQDVLNHFEIFVPDAYVCFVDSITSDSVNQIGPLRESKQYNGVPIIAIGKDDVCRDLEVHNMNSPDLVIRRPISPDNLSLRITRLLDELKAGANETPELKAPKVMIGQKVKSDVKKQILIVDDDRTVLTMLKKALSDEYDVTTMVNSMLLEKCIDTKKVDLIILDYEMPNETGADVFRRLKANEKSKDIPVCFLTGVADRNKIMEIMQLKPHGYLLKPIDIEMLKSTIGTLME